MKLKERLAVASHEYEAKGTLGTECNHSFYDGANWVLAEVQPVLDALEFYAKRTLALAYQDTDERETEYARLFAKQALAKFKGETP